MQPYIMEDKARFDTQLGVVKVHDEPISSWEVKQNVCEQKFNDAVQERWGTVVRGKRRHQLGQVAILAKLEDLHAEMKTTSMSVKKKKEVRNAEL